MKVFVILGIMIGLFTCSSLPTENEDSKTANSSVKFSMQTPSSVNSNILFNSTGNEDTPSKVSLSYRKSGEENETNVSINLTAFGNSYITDDVLSLSDGNYLVTKFDVLNDSGITIYSTPKTGSKVATSLDISTSLEYAFETVEGKVTTVNMEVAEVDDNSNPADFGHAAFTFEIVDYNIFYIEVLALDSTGWNYTKANLIVKNAIAKVIAEENLSEEMNKIIVADEDAYTLIIEKDGYTSQEFSFTKDELAQYETKALVVKLKESSTIITDGLVAYYSFDKDANDYSGNEHNGTVYGNTSLVEGKVGNAYSFNGNGDYIYVPFHEDFNFESNGQFTISLWLYWDKYQTGYIGCADIFGKVNASDYTDWNLHIMNSSNILKFHSENGNVFSNYVISTNNWIHIVLTYNNGEVKYYINNELDNTGNMTLHQSTSGIAFGKKGESGNNRWFYGKLDEARIYNKELSQEEIAELYNQGK